MASHPITDTVLESRKNLVIWLNEFHNDVSKNNGKLPISNELIAYIFKKNYNINLNEILNFNTPKTTTMTSSPMLFTKNFKNITAINPIKPLTSLKSTNFSSFKPQFVSPKTSTKSCGCK